MTDKLAERFWPLVAAVMAYKGLGQDDLARAIGMERTALNSKKNGKRRTTLDDVDAVLTALPELHLHLSVDLAGTADNRGYLSIGDLPEQVKSHVA